MIEYLLGGLDEAAAAQVEERLFLDAGLAEYLEGLEAELVRDYLRGQLDPATRVLFEDRMEEDPLLDAKVQEASQLLALLEQEAPVESWGRRLTALFSRPGVAWASGAVCLAAAVVLLFQATLWHDRAKQLEQENSELRKQQPRGAQDAGREVYQAFAAPVFRLTPGVLMSSAREQRFAVPAGTGEVVLELESRGVVPAAGSYRVVLQDPDGTRLWTGGCDRVPDGWRVRAPATVLRPGSYTLSVTAADPGNMTQLATYSFAVSP
jgi:hypothetical protein